MTENAVLEIFKKIQADLVVVKGPTVVRAYDQGHDD
jgi:hypothetical protein